MPGIIFNYVWESCTVSVRVAVKWINLAGHKLSAIAMNNFGLVRLNERIADVPIQ